MKQYQSIKSVIGSNNGKQIESMQVGRARKKSGSQYQREAGDEGPKKKWGLVAHHIDLSSPS